MSKFQTLRVTEICRETPESVSILLKPVSGESFSFLAGQYLTLLAKIDGEDVRRSYSLCSSPSEGVLRVAVKEVPGGKFSTFCNRMLAVGDTLESLPPDGRFTRDFKDSVKNHLAIAAGSGITPVISIIKDVLSTDSSAKFTLCYVNIETSSIIFKDELSDLKDIYLERLQLFNFLTREPAEIELFSGRLDSKRLSRLFPEVISPTSFDVAYLCGPESMISDCRTALTGAGMPDSAVKYELFTSSSDHVKEPPIEATSSASGEEVEVSIVLDGVTTQVSVKRSGKSILDAALDSGVDAPFSCQGGVCCTCRCKMTSGSASMDINFALEEEEVENGYVLACQSHPEGDGPFVMDFDQP